MHWTDFRMIVSGQHYQVSNYYFNGQCLMSGSDGTNSYFLNKMATVESNRWELGEVTQGRFPSKDASAGQLCWLAFASGGYFTKAVASLPVEAFQQNANYFKYDSVLSTNAPYLPLSIQWNGSGFWYMVKEDTNNRVELPYTNGFLAGEYIVTSKTNFESLDLPLGFEFSTFIPNHMGPNQPAAERKEVTLASLLRARVNSIKFVDIEGDLRPPLGSRAQITDGRIPLLPNKNHLSVTRLNGKWPEPGDRDFERSLSIANLSNDPNYTPPTSKAAMRTRRIVVLIALIGSLAGLLILLLKQRKIKPSMKGN